MNIISKGTASNCETLAPHGSTHSSQRKCWLTPVIITHILGHTRRLGVIHSYPYHRGMLQFNYSACFCQPLKRMSLPKKQLAGLCLFKGLPLPSKRISRKGLLIDRTRWHDLCNLSKRGIGTWMGMEPIFFDDFWGGSKSRCITKLGRILNLSLRGSVSSTFRSHPK